MLVRARLFMSPFCLCFLVSTALLAQKYAPKQITFSGYSSVSQAELLAASGLTAGVPLGQPEMQAAAQKLSDTGLFSDIRFSFDGSQLLYTLTPATGAGPVYYQNFPWWDTKSLTAAVAAKVPLFHGSAVPESGLQNQIVTALTALVQEKGVTATVTAVPRKDESSGAIKGIEFRIDSPPIQLGEVKFRGASGAWTDKLAAIQKAAAGQDYSEGTESTLRQAVSAIYHRQGFLDISMTHFAYGQPQFLNGKVLVPVSITLQEGPQYFLKGLTLSGDILMTSEDFAKRAKIHANDVANEDLLRQTLAEVARPYKAKGYLRATVNANPVFDRWTHTVDYAVTVTPGPVFHMGKLTLLNLDAEKQALVMTYWTLNQGDVYDATYAPTFLNRNRSNLHALDAWSATYKQYENEDTHVVDLVVSFQQGGPLH
jgi:outer membrane protein assembly factor BamA